MIARLLLAIIVLVVGVRSVQIQEQAEYRNDEGITIEDGGPTTPYPSTMDIDIGYKPKTLKVTLWNVTHSMEWTRVVLVNPTGLKIPLASEGKVYWVGHRNNGVTTFTFDQSVNFNEHPYQGALQNKAYYPVSKIEEDLSAPGDYL